MIFATNQIKGDSRTAKIKSGGGRVSPCRCCPKTKDEKYRGISKYILYIPRLI